MGPDHLGGNMKDERAHLQLFDLIARDWMLASPATGVTFNADDSAVAFACGDGAVFLAATADKESSNTRIRRAVDTARVTIAPRSKSFAPLKPADYTEGRKSDVVRHGVRNFAFAKTNGRVNTLTPGGIAVHLPCKGTGEIAALAITSDGNTLAYACGDTVYLTASDADEKLGLLAPAGINGLAFSPDNTTLAVAHDHGVTLWNVANADDASLTLPLAGSPVAVDWRADGAWLSVRLKSTGFCTVDIATHKSYPHGNFPSHVLSVAFGGATNSVVAAGAFRVAAWGLDDQRDIMSGKAGLVLINAVATCPTRNLVAVGYANGLLSLAEIGRPSEILLREDTGAGITAMAWSTNGKFLAVAGADGSAALVEFPDSMFKS